MGSEHTAQPSQPSWILELQQPHYCSLTHKISALSGNCFFHDVHWLEEEQAIRAETCGCWPCSCFASLWALGQCPGHVHAVQICTVLSIFSSSSDGVQVSLQVQQKWSEDPGFRRGPCIAMLQPDSWSGRGMLPALLPTLEIDGLSPSQIITRYFS